MSWAMGSARAAAAGARKGRGGIVAVPNSCGAAAGSLEPISAVRPVTPVADAGLQGSGLAPGELMRTAGRGGEFGADGVGQALGGGVQRGGQGFGDGKLAEGGGGLARCLQRHGLDPPINGTLLVWFGRRVAFCFGGGPAIRRGRAWRA